MNLKSFVIGIALTSLASTVLANTATLHFAGAIADSGNLTATVYTADKKVEKTYQMNPSQYPNGEQFQFNSNTDQLQVKWNGELSNQIITLNKNCLNPVTFDNSQVFLSC